MDKSSIEKYISEMCLNKNIELNDIPEIDLYMDQVIQLFESHYSDTIRNKDEKILTKTMINNYAKGKLLMSIKNKKYSKEHIMLMNLIYALKGSLSLTDIKTALDPIIQCYENENIADYPLRELYENILTSSQNNLEVFTSSIPKIDKNVKSITATNNFNENYEQNLLLLISFVSLSNMYRKMAEKVIDGFNHNE